MKIKVFTLFLLLVMVMTSGAAFAKEYSAGVAYTTTNLENDNELTGYSLNLLYEVGEGEDPYNLPEGIYQGGWQYEKLTSKEEGVSEINLNGASMVIDGRIGKNNLKPLITLTMGYYWGEKEDKINNVTEDIKGFGLVPSVGATYNMNSFELYASADYRKMFVGDHDLDGFGYRVGFLVNF